MQRGNQSRIKNRSKKHGAFGKHHLLTFSSRTNLSFVKSYSCNYPPPPLLLEKTFYGV